MDKQRFYINSIGSRITGQDFLLLGATQATVQPLFTPDDATLEIYMSPLTMKNLYRHLQSAVEMYEKLYGTIQENPNMDAAAEIQQELGPELFRVIQNNLKQE